MTNPAQKIDQALRMLNEARAELGDLMKDERGRKRGELNRLLFQTSRRLNESNVYFSQAGQDRIVDNAMQAKRDGVFVDVGGYDGVTGSNSLFFEMFRGWSGILIEPSPTQLRMAKAVRQCPCLGYAVAGTAGEAEFLEVTQGFTQMSGFLDSYEAKLLEQVRGNPRHKEVMHTLKKMPLNEILAEQKIEQVDFMSLDVEGGEMDILENFDFDAVDVAIWTIENNTRGSDIPNFMKDKGYQLFEFAGVDDLFRKA